MQLGDFVFELSTLAPDNIDTSITAKWAKQARYGGRPALQFTGIEGETKTLAGVIYPSSGITGTAKDLDEIDKMITSGKPYILVGSDGFIKGQFAILSKAEKHSHIDKGGKAQKIEFTIALERVDNERINRLL